MRIRAADIAITVFVDIFRTLPQLVVIVFIYFGLPYADIQLSPFAATVVALGAVLAAFATEIFWAAIQAVPQGQWDAARSLGLGFLRILFLVILPQAIRIAVPLLTNRAIAITKGTALGTAVSLPELLGRAQSAMAIAANPSPLTLAAALYLLFFLPLVVASRWLEGLGADGAALTWKRCSSSSTISPTGTRSSASGRCCGRACSSPSCSRSSRCRSPSRSAC